MGLSYHSAACPYHRARAAAYRAKAERHLARAEAHRTQFLAAETRRLRSCTQISPRNIARALTAFREVDREKEPQLTSTTNGAISPTRARRATTRRVRYGPDARACSAHAAAKRVEERLALAQRARHEPLQVALGLARADARAARVATAGLVALCDLPPDEAWLSLVFYRSKYYEFVDTWLVVLAGKRPSLLQVYHHVGVVAVMRGALAAGTGPILLLTPMNATVHAAMYAYYALATVGLKWRHARLLTQMQLAQFVVGVGLTSVVYFTDAGSCGDARARAAIVGVHVYVAGLVALFSRFYRARYAPCVRGPR